jgi:predicted dienelactone hydrolase
VNRSTSLAIALLCAACGGNRSQPLADASTSPPDDGAPGDDAALIDPAGDGLFTIDESTASIPGSAAGRTLAATIYRPGGAAMPPLVVVSPGFQMRRTQYASYARHLATWGFTVVLTDYADAGFFPDHQKLADDVSAVIDHAIAQLAVDPARIAAAGHSLGGKISVFAATQDPRIGAVIGWDPVDSQSPSVAPQKMAGMTAAVAVVGETTNASGGGMPCAPAAENFEQFYAAAPAPAISLAVRGADHMDWVDDPSCSLCGFCTAGGAPAELARTVTRRLDVAWLRRRLLGDGAMERWLANPPELADGSLTINRR